jgi:hypothetical protein
VVQPEIAAFPVTKPGEFSKITFVSKLGFGIAGAAQAVGPAKDARTMLNKQARCSIRVSGRGRFMGTGILSG